jgi:MFS family permease
MPELALAPDRRTRARLLRVLVGAQVLGGLGGAAASAAALLAVALTGREALASLPLAVLVVGSSAVVVPVSALSRRAGRRAGLGAALALAAVGALGVVAAAALASFALLLVAIAAFGAGNAAVMLARYAAADLSTPERRGRAIGSVVFATTFGAVAGPNLLAPAGRLATALGLPALSGLFLVAAAAYGLAALALLALLRPDPLQVAAGAALSEGEAGAPRPALRSLLAGPAARAGLLTMLVANFAMVAVMAMAPVQMRDHGHGLEVIGLVVSVHIAGMFAPAPLTGRLTDRHGPLPVAAAGAALLVVAGALSATAGHHGLWFALGLGLLGVGWNLGLIAGSTLLAAAVALPQRPRAEAVGELGMGFTAGVGTALAGPITGLAGYATLAALAAAAAAALGPLLVGLARQGAPAPRALAPRVLG